MISSPFTLFFSLKIHFAMVKSSLNGNTIYLRLLSIKGCDAIRPVLHFFFFREKNGKVSVPTEYLDQF